MTVRWAAGPVIFEANGRTNISAVFTWDLPKVLYIATGLTNLGVRVRVGGPAVHVRTDDRRRLAEVADVGGNVSDAVARHNPDATFASRGCPVGCWFCIVPSMEGREFTLIDDFPVRPILCDNNLSALPADFQAHIVRRYQTTGVPLLDANSGFEPRTFDRDVFERWQPINRGPWRFACDDAGDAPYVWRVLEMLQERVTNPRRKRVYVLIGNEPFDACMERITRVLELGAEPHVQPLMKLNAPSRDPWVRFDWTADRLRAVARWANRRTWKYATFAQYNPAVRTGRGKMTNQGDLFAEEAV